MDVLSARLLQGTVWFCINLDVLRASNTFAVFRKGQADNNVSFDIEGFGVDRSGKRAPLHFKDYIYIYIFININNIYIYICKCVSCTQCDSVFWTF